MAAGDDAHSCLGLWLLILLGTGLTCFGPQAWSGGGRLQQFLPGCVGWGFSNLPIVAHAKTNKIDPY